MLLDAGVDERSLPDLVLGVHGGAPVNQNSPNLIRSYHTITDNQFNIQVVTKSFFFHEFVSLFIITTSLHSFNL